ncbi:unnamed protein product [Closterium sp. Yama58-4]|nr:unnamed protein product [Closterium sp. Yama58-4]
MGKGNGTEKGAKQPAPTPCSEGKCATAATRAQTRAQARARGVPLQLPWLPSRNASHPGPHSRRGPHSPTAGGAGSTGTGRQQHEPHPAAPHRAGDCAQHQACSAGQHAVGQAPSRGVRDTPRRLTSAAPTGQCSPLSGCLRHTAPTKTRAEQGRSKYPALATTPPAGQEHRPEVREESSGETDAPGARPAEGEDAVAAAPGPQHCPVGRQEREGPREDPRMAPTEEAEKEAAMEAVRPGSVEAEEVRPVRRPSAREPPTTAWTRTAAAGVPEGTPTLAAVVVSAPNSDPMRQTAPSTGRATGVLTQTSAAAATRRLGSAAEEAAEAAEAASEAASEEPAVPEAAVAKPGTALTVGQEAATAGESAGGGMTGHGPLDGDGFAHGENDKSAPETQTKRQAPGKNCRSPRPQQHQRRLGAGLAPARPGPLVGWTQQDDSPQAAAEAGDGADPSSTCCREIAAEAREDAMEALDERESAAEDAMERRAETRHNRHRGETSRQQALRAQANQCAAGRPPQNEGAWSGSEGSMREGPGQRRGPGEPGESSGEVKSQIGGLAGKTRKARTDWHTAEC